jgi:hypothetical protein
MTFYGSPVVQAVSGLKTTGALVKVERTKRWYAALCLSQWVEVELFAD